MKAWLEPDRLQGAARWLWGLVLVSMPVTTFRYLPGVFGQTQIKPLAFIPLAVLLPVLALLFWRRRRLPLPGNATPLIAFLLFALIASAAGWLLAPIPLRTLDLGGRVLRAWLSLGIGLTFFAVAFWMNRDEKDLRWSLKWLYAGLAITLAWSLVQALAVNTDWLTHEFIDRIQLSFSDIGIQPRRIIGFAYEPAWLADQMVLLYTPWLLAALLTKFGRFERKWVEPLLLALAAAVVLFTYSRSGLLIGLVSGAVVLLAVGGLALKRVWAWFAAPFHGANRRGLGLRLGVVAGLLLALVAAAGFLASYDYITNLFEVDEDETLVEYIVKISAGPRLAYTLAGYQVFEQAPFTGVGLGASSLYLFDHYPEWSFNIPEIRKQMAPDSTVLPNPKSLYTRLLAETGLPGLWLFAIFLLSLLGMIRSLYLSSTPWRRYVAVAALFAWIGLLMRNLTQDSLTFPIMWIMFGMLVGFATYSTAENRKD